MKHWIVQTAIGYAHVESDQPPVAAHILAVAEGPFETAEEAWYAHNWRMGHINT